MRLLRLQINKFGPLKFNKPVELSGFNLFWGDNERGKSLTIESILASLPFIFKGEKRRWDFIRVEEDPDVILELEEEGKIYSIKQGKTLNSSLSRDEFFKLYFILNSEVPYDLKNEKNKDLFKGAIDRLSNTYTKDIEGIIEQILDMNFLTPKLEYSDSKESENRKSRLEKGIKFSETVDEFLRKVKSENLDEIELQIAEKKKELERLSKEEEKTKAIKAKQRYQKSSDLLERYQQVSSSLNSLTYYTDELLLKLEKMKEQVEIIDRNLKDLDENRAKIVEERLKSLEAKVSEGIKLQAEKQRIETSERVLKEKIIQYKTERPRYEKHLKDKKKFQLIAILFGLFFISSVFLSFFLKNALFFASAVIFFSGTFTFFILYSQAVTGIRDFKQMEKELFDRARSLDLPYNNLDHLEEVIENRKSDILNREMEIERAKAELKSVKEQIESYNKQIKQLEEERVKLKSYIESELEKLGIGDIAELKEKVERRRSLEIEKSSVFNELKGLWGNDIEFEDEQDLIVKVNREIMKMAPTYEEPESISEEKSMQDLDTLEKQKKELLSEIEALNGKIEGLKREFGILEKLYEEIMREPFTISNFSDVKEAQERVLNWVSEMKKKKELIIQLIKLIDEEFKKSKERLSDLFTDLSDTSWIFNEITGQRYNRIIFDQEKSDQKKEMMLWVEDRDGNMLEAWKLSGGTLDQLFFAIRLGLGRKLLSERKGFFVLDDPFVKADGERLKRGLDLLMKISDEGWQVLYFTCKEEVKEYLLNTYGDRVNFIDLNQIATLG